MKIMVFIFVVMLVSCKESPKRDWQTKEQWRQDIIKHEKEKFDLYIVMGNNHKQAIDSVRADRERQHAGTVYKDAEMQEWFEEYKAQDTAYLYYQNHINN